MAVSVSIVIVNFNTFSLTRNCIQSIGNLIKDTTYEIILVDNASTERDADDFTAIFPDLIMVKNQENVGFAKGNNLGISKAKGEYILLLNSDTILKNDAISIVKNFLDSNAGVAVATARLEYPDGSLQHNCQRFPSIRYLLFELLRLQKIFPTKRKKLFGSFFDYNTIAYPDWVWGTFFMFKKNLLHKLPDQKLAEDFFMYVEDMQWCMEFRKLGFEIAFLPNAEVIHFMGSSKGKKNILMRQNVNAFMKQYYPTWKRILIRLLNFLLTGFYAA